MQCTSSTITRQTRRPKPSRKAPLHRLLCLLCVLALMPIGALASNVPTTMRVALVSDPTLELYPLQIQDRDMRSMLNLVYESLIELDDSRQPIPALATSWTSSSNGSTWTFTLREDVRFHDGRELTAYDVVATLDAIKSMAGDLETAPSAENGPYANVPRVIKSWKADTAYSLTLQTSRPNSLLYALTFPILQAQSTMQPNPPGTGPYRIGYFSPGEEIWLVGNEAWYGPPPYISEINGIWYETIEAAMRDYEIENIDIFMTRSPSAIRYRGTGSSLSNSYDYSTQQLELLMINNGVRMLSTAEMRQAIAYAINKPRLATNVYQGLVTATDTIQTPASWLYNEDAFVYSYDPNKANEILDEIGWNNRNESGHRIRRTESGDTQTLDLRLYYYDEAGNSLRKEVANEIATMLRAVGFRIRVTSMTFENGTAKLKSGDFDLFLGAYHVDTVPDPSFMLLSNGYGNYVRYRSDTVNKACQKLRSTADSDEFTQLWDSIQAQLALDVPFVPLYWRGGVVLTRYPFSSVRDIREFELLKSINEYK